MDVCSSSPDPQWVGDSDLPGSGPVNVGVSGLGLASSRLAASGISDFAPSASLLPGARLSVAKRRGAGRSAVGGRGCARGASSTSASGGSSAFVGKAARRNSAQADLGLRLSKKASLSASETTIYKLIKFLPQSARMLLEVLQSVSRLQKLVNAYGGTVVRVPLCKWTPDAPLVAVLGVRAMERFMVAYKGTDVYVPMCVDFLRRVRDLNINRAYARLRKKGLSCQKSLHTLCRQYNLSQSRVRTIVCSAEH